MRYLLLKRLALSVLFINAGLNAEAQFTAARIGVDGLTCSQCTRNVEMRIRKLRFVQDVQMDLQHTEGSISFKAGEKTDISRVAQAIHDAGFSVRFLEATFNFNSVTLSGDNCFNYSGDSYQFVVPPKQLNGPCRIKFAGKGYMPKKDQNKWKAVKSTCYNNSGNLYYILQ